MRHSPGFLLCEHREREFGLVNVTLTLISTVHRYLVASTCVTVFNVNSRQQSSNKSINLCLSLLCELTCKLYGVSELHRLVTLNVR